MADHLHEEELPIVDLDDAAPPADGPAGAAADNDGDAINNHNVLRIEDFEAWLSNNAIAGGSASINMSADGRNEVERFQAHESYQQELHGRLFPHIPESNEQINRELTLKRFESMQFSFLLQKSDENDDLNSHVIQVPLRLVAERCETVFVAATRHGCTQLSLEDYPAAAVRHVIRILSHRSTVEATPDDLVVECCRLVHYLQHEELVERYSQLLTESVDTENCLSLLQLADRLELPRLLERSLSHVINTLDQVRNDIPELLTRELQERIVVIQSILQSSINGYLSTSDRSNKLFFTTLEEYIAIFAERVEYFRERLDSAKEQRDELLSGANGSGTNDNAGQQGPTVGRFVSPRPVMLSQVASQQYMADLEQKIAKQEKRFKTLEIALREQKKLFAKRQKSSV